MGFPRRASGCKGTLLSLTVSFAVLLAALLHASWNAMIKGGNDVLLDTAAIVVGAGLVAAPFLFLVPLPTRFSRKPLPTARVLPASSAASLARRCFT